MDPRVAHGNFFYDNDIYIAGFMVIGDFGLWINFVLLKISIWKEWGNFIVDFIFET